MIAMLAYGISLSGAEAAGTVRESNRDAGAAYDGIGIPACIATAQAAARQVTGYLAGVATPASGPPASPRALDPTPDSRR